MFQIVKKDKRTLARVGTLTVPHGGVLETPAFTMVGTRAKVITLEPEDLLRTKTGIVIANTYHLWRGLHDKLSEFKGLHEVMQYDGVIATDSGGFQVFSLGFGREHEVSKIGFFPEGDTTPGFLSDLWLQIRIWLGIKHSRNSVRVMPWGAYFKDENYGDEKPVFLDAEKSMKIQEKLGADIILAFDECTSPRHGRHYTKWAMHRTHKWAKRCLEVKSNSRQLLYGIVQGGAFEDLRKESAQVIGRMPFDGFAIGGSLGNSKEDMYRVLEWSIPYLPEDKPRHLLGIGQIRDIFEGVERGIDTFDCVIPTREARHGGIWTYDGRYDVTKGANRDIHVALFDGCMCPACATGVTRAKLRELFKAKDKEAGRLATLHNVYFFNDLMRQIREAIIEDRFSEFKEEMLKRIAK
ncbi:MAG: tRNA guanosine(34) transglycosylase Tgt [Patescibacteria group bacterium]